MFIIKGLGTQSRREFTFQLDFKSEAALLRAIHSGGRPTATAIFHALTLTNFIASTYKLTPTSEPAKLDGRRSRGGHIITLRVKRPDTNSIQMALLDASGVTVNSTLFDSRTWDHWTRDILKHAIGTGRGEACALSA